MFAGIAGAVAGIIGSIVNGYQAWKTRKYQEEVQETMWEREDNAVQRRKADLIAAGMSPTLAAGDAASSGPVVSVQSPRSGDVGIQVMEALRVAADIAQTQASTELARHQMHKTDIDALKSMYETKQVQANTDKTIIDTKKSLTSIDEINARVASLMHDLNINRDAGTPSSPSFFGKIYRDIMGAGERSRVLHSADEKLRLFFKSFNPAYNIKGGK